MPADPDSKVLEELGEESKESIERAHALVDELRTVQDYENEVLEDASPPLSKRQGGNLTST